MPETQWQDVNGLSEHGAGIIPFLRPCIQLYKYFAAFS